MRKIHLFVIWAILPQIAYCQLVSSYTVYKLENKIGREEVVTNTTVKYTAAQISVVTNDRGTAMKLNARFLVANDKLQYASTGNTSRFTTEKIDTVFVLGDGFPLSANGSIKMRELLIAYWMKAGRPDSLLSALSKRYIKISIIGTEKDPLTNHNLTAFDIDNGRNDIFWMDDKGKAVYLVTCDAEGDKREVIDDKYLSYLGDLTHKSGGYLIKAYLNSNKTLGRYFSDIAIVGGNVIDLTDSGKVHTNTMLLLHDGKISYVGDINKALIPAGAQVIDAANRFLIPGLWNMHVHLFHPNYLKQELLSGVTTVRDMGNEFDFIISLKDAAKDPAFPAPHILNAGILDGNSPFSLGIMRATNATEIRQNVKKYHDAGFNQVKIYSYIKKNDFDDIVKEARLYNMDVVGHLPVGYTVGYFIDNGMNSISHIHYFMNSLKWNGHDLKAGNKDLLDKLIARKTYLDPTLNIYTLTGDKKIPLYNRIVKLFFDYGVPIVAGTDNEGTIAGEIQNYVALGLSPLDAIRSATIVPATVMKMNAQTGSIEKGKDADLLILNDNPLQNIKTLNHINTIIKGQLVIDN